MEKDTAPSAILPSSKPCTHRHDIHVSSKCKMKICPCPIRSCASPRGEKGSASHLEAGPRMLWFVVGVCVGDSERMCLHCFSPSRDTSVPYVKGDGDQTQTLLHGWRYPSCGRFRLRTLCALGRWRGMDEEGG